MRGVVVVVKFGVRSALKPDRVEVLGGWLVPSPYLFKAFRPAFLVKKITYHKKYFF